MKAVLFDIENTLVKESKDVSQYFYEAIRSSYGLSIDDIKLSDYEGHTVQETVEDILKRQGLSKEEVMEKQELFLEELPYAHYNVAGHDKAVLLGGAKDLLDRLSKKNDYVIGVATGQLERILRNMFERSGLDYDQYFKFGFYGNTSEHITRILDAAINRAEKDYGVKRQDISFVTNSRRYASAAHSVGINAIAVVTDPYSKKQLDHFEAGHVVKNLKECEKLIK
jgi:phosphoglycolate phosphatase-like HAD superfamily hydrolase